MIRRYQCQAAIPPASTKGAKKDVGRTEKPFNEHDVVFLPMNSRESRWLPTVLGAANGKIILNAVLRFDTYLVTSHGDVQSTDIHSHIFSYSLAIESLTDHTLNQMYTVTGPGLASIAASTAVELLVSSLRRLDG
ncbi:hypothetical protein DFH29DRAFT_814554 [Suillus ampliporus]|nr:hypothetical protein DFH29DRAFT_814554 [Suillus ampliporus]